MDHSLKQLNKLKTTELSWFLNLASLMGQCSNGVVIRQGCETKVLCSLVSKMGKVVSSPCEYSQAERWLTRRFGPGADCGPVHTPSELAQLPCGWCPKCSKHNSWMWCNSNHDNIDFFAQWACCFEQISWPWMELGSCLGCCHWGPAKVLDFLDTQIRCLWEYFSTSLHVRQTLHLRQSQHLHHP